MQRFLTYVWLIPDTAELLGEASALTPAFVASKS